MQIINFLFSFQGRIARRAYWTLVLGVCFVSTLAGGVMGVLADEDGNSAYVGIIAAVLVLPCMWIGLAAQIRRWHDRGRSGWRVLINLIPIVGALWTLVELGFLKGTEGVNRFGANPLQKAA
jgi:uncharacterized membrane protein YhaH (DUF805 family)